ncbi:MAG: hypothetical protein LBD87_00055 [Prevotellaceae bacterium]|jgi:hypothetical protein|nr:hypothetical protein [Prevotellaceae bacterium]
MNPAILSKALIRRGVLLHAEEFDHIDHGKFFVIIGENEQGFVGFFFINSNINNYVKSRPDFMDMQMPIKHSNYPDILSYDSFIACHALSQIPKIKLAQQIECGAAQFKGTLLTEDLELLLENLRSSKLYSKVEKETFFK